MSMAGPGTTAIAPALIRGNGWSPADFAKVGSIALFTSFAFPVIGRLADVLGVRWTALIGMVTLPLAYLAYSIWSARNSRDRINHDAHLGGALAGLVFVALFDPQAYVRAWELVAS
jgi:membrane associated rhomboid family serine protease